MRSTYTRRRLLDFGLGFAALTVIDYSDAAGPFRLMSAAEASEQGGNSGSGGGGSGSGSSGSGGGTSGSSGSGGGTSGSSGSGNGTGTNSGSDGANSGPGGGGNSGPGSGNTAGERRTGHSNSQVERYLDTLHSRGQVVWANVAGDSIEVRYSDGWSEQVTPRRYRLRDPAKRIVIERAAKTLDFERLRSAAR
jgi:hypothetical protein